MRTFGLLRLGTHKFALRLRVPPESLPRLLALSSFPALPAALVLEPARQATFRSQLRPELACSSSPPTACIQYRATALPVRGEQSNAAWSEIGTQFGLSSADLIDLFLYCKFVEARKRQAEEQADPSFEKQVSVTKSTFDLLGRAFSLRGIGNAPMCRHWLPGPNGTHFLGGVVANGENEIHLRRSVLCKLLPVLAAQAFHGQARQANQLESFSSHNSRRVASRAVSRKNRSPFAVENCLAHDRTNR